jgi:3-oxoacyl-[acyl-carrier protein] reductase
VRTTTQTETVGATRAVTTGPLAGRTAIVVGASRGLGLGIVTGFAAAGANVVAVSRTMPATVAPAGAAENIRWESADAGEATVAARLIDRYDPDIVVLVAGATPHMRSLQQQTWDTFSIHWQTDVRIAFHWLRESLLKPLRPGSRVIVVSSGAALGGSPLSGGYAGSKATQRFIAAYAQDEAKRAGLDITFTAILPRFAPTTGVGQPAVQAYAARNGVSVEDFLRTHRETSGPSVTPEIASTALLQLVQAEASATAPSYLLTGTGLQALS